MTIRYILSLILLVAASAGLLSPAAAAFDLSHYTTKSALSEGRWIKVSVDESGIYMIPTATLRQWGFNDPSKVKIYGYGGNRITDVMTAANYVDDLPQIASEITDAGLVFYGVGPEKWVVTAGSSYRRDSNPYTTKGYYFVSDAIDEERLTPGTSGVSPTGTPLEMATATVQYEQELVQATEAGPLLVGEDFRYTPRRNFTILTPGLVGGTNVWMECQMFVKTIGSSSKMAFTVDGKELPAVSSDVMPSTSDSHYIHGNIGQARHTFPVEKDADALVIGASLSSTTVVYKAHLDYIALNYMRHLTMPQSGALLFRSSVRSLRLKGVDAATRVWDVTDPAAITSIEGDRADGAMAWGTSFSGNRVYAAWRAGTPLPAPATVGVVPNQDLHADDTPYDMVIFAPTALMSQAERIAQLHRTHDGMQVKVADVEKVYNEFSSGMPDMNGMRKYLKMLYDRSRGSDHPLGYALLLGRVTMDNRRLLATTNSMGHITLPAWVPTLDRASMSDNDGYTTDDVMAMLGDGSGKDHGLDELSVAVGRIPMISASDGDEIVDKLEQYILRSKTGNWRNRVMTLADDEDLGVHLRQTDGMVNLMQSANDCNHIIDKIYLDAYTMVGGEYPAARRDMFRLLDEGVVWWFYVGHANNHSWTGDGQLTFSDINSMYLRNYPIVVASTCDFLRWDSETTSGGEIMYKERYGGAIAMVSATRPVYITDNGYMLNAWGRQIFARDDKGRLLRAGEVYRRAKNNILTNSGRHDSNSNRLRFVFMGDPAMRTVSPDNTVEVTAINGQTPTDDAQVTIAALQQATIAGHITGTDGEPMADFDGIVNLDLYDATTSKTTNARGNGSVEVFDVHGDKLYSGSAVVKNGEFELKVAMPSLIAENFRPATMSLYAVSADGNREAIGLFDKFFVYGFEEPDTPDTDAPVIDFLGLNHSGFSSGQTVNSAPVVMASVSDNVGVNLSTAGVGQQMMITLDGNQHYTDVASFYTPATDGSASGTISYPLENLADGAHTLRLRVFDTSGNAATREVEFFVDDTAKPQIFDVYTDANPASTSCNFYVRHDRPEMIISVVVSVFNLLGQPVWTGTSTGMSDGDVSSPVNWNLCDSAGRRVNRGIYVYRASITTDKANYVTASRRLAVTAP